MSGHGHATASVDTHKPRVDAFNPKTVLEEEGMLEYMEEFMMKTTSANYKICLIADFCDRFCI